MQSRFAVSYIEPISNPLPTANPVRCTRRLFCFAPYLKICFVTRTATWHYRARLFVLGRGFEMGSICYYYKMNKAFLFDPDGVW